MVFKILIKKGLINGTYTICFEKFNPKIIGEAGFDFAYQNTLVTSRSFLDIVMTEDNSSRIYLPGASDYENSPGYTIHKRHLKKFLEIILAYKKFAEIKLKEAQYDNKNGV